MSALEAVVAVYADWGIGRGGTQPVVVRADRRRFREISGDAAEGFIITNSHTPKPPVVPPPRTGDESHLVRYTMLMSLSFAGIVFVLTKKRKEERA